MTTGIDWEAVVAEIQDAPWEADYAPGVEERRVFLGTVFALYPSGKYYMPWACSNVTEREAAEDEAFREQLEAEAEKRGLYIANGEGDPCDVFAVEARDVA
jgi:hypothetical protein